MMPNHFLRRQSPEKNEDRYYHIHVTPDLLGQWDVVCEWGRVGSPGTIKRLLCLTELEADTRADKIAAIKIKRGYVPRYDPEHAGRDRSITH